MKQLIGLIVILFSSAGWTAPNEAPSFETVVEDVIFNTSSRVVIDEKTIKNSEAPNVTTLLSSTANVTITNTPFQPNSIYIRGGDASHVLILVDGVPFYDASTIQRTFNLNALDIRSIRRIEILKGSQTVLYGGQALSGVIMIETLPQETQGSNSGVQGQFGTYNYKNLGFYHAEETGENQAAVFRGQGSWRDSQSPVLGSSKTYANNNLNGEAAYVWKGAFEGFLKGSYVQQQNFSATPDYTTFRVADVDDFEQYSRQLAASARLKFNEVPLKPRLTLSAQNSVRTFDMPVNSSVPMLTDEDYGANLRTTRLDIQPWESSQVTVNAGLSYVHEDFVFRDKNVEATNKFAEQHGLFAKADYRPLENVELSVGGRVEKWGNKEAVSTHQVGLTLFQRTRLEWATGYKIPSLFQLYSRYGNPDLSEERAVQYSLIQDIPLTENQNLSLTFFNSQFSDLIIYTGSGMSGKYNNVNKAESRGVEVVYTLRPTDHSSLLATYGYQEPRDISNDQWLPRRPLVNGSLRYTHSFYDTHVLTGEVIAAGAREDRSGPLSAKMAGYAIANAAYTYKVSDDLRTFVRVNNLTDYRYEETLSFYAEGVSAFAGAEYWF